jgi:hypothetical protein
MQDCHWCSKKSMSPYKPYFSVMQFQGKASCLEATSVSELHSETDDSSVEALSRAEESDLWNTGMAIMRHEWIH